MDDASAVGTPRATIEILHWQQQHDAAELLEIEIAIDFVADRSGEVG